MVRSTAPHAAPSRRRFVFAEVDATIRAVPEFGSSRSRPPRSGKRWRWGRGLAAGTVYEVLPGDKEAAHGLAPTLWIYDELGIAPNRQLLDALADCFGKERPVSRHRYLDPSCEMTGTLSPSS